MVSKDIHNAPLFCFFPPPTSPSLSPCVWIAALYLQIPICYTLCLQTNSASICAATTCTMGADVRMWSPNTCPSPISYVVKAKLFAPIPHNNHLNPNIPNCDKVTQKWSHLYARPPSPHEHAPLSSPRPIQAHLLNDICRAASAPQATSLYGTPSLWVTRCALPYRCEEDP